MIEDIEGITLLLFIVILSMCMGMLILLGIQLAYGNSPFVPIMTPIPDTYKECITSELPEWYCELLYPPLNRESV